MLDNTVLSFEFFPPKTPRGEENLGNTWRELNTLKPEYVSVTYGAGGSTRDKTFDTVAQIHAAGINVAPHLSFGGDSPEVMEQLLAQYQAMGIKRLVALRGDMPSGMGGAGHLVYANELVAFIREKTGRHFHIEVAAYPEIHPQSRDYDKDIHFLKAKFEAGADSAITQYFYNPDAYAYYLDRCTAAGIEQPIVPGIMPISNYNNLARFSDGCGAEIPRWIRKQLEAYADDRDSIRAFGIEVVTRLCERLLQQGAPGLHFYTMNSVKPTQAICHNLGFVGSTTL